MYTCNVFINEKKNANTLRNTCIKFIAHTFDISTLTCMRIWQSERERRRGYFKCCFLFKISGAT